MEKYKNAEEYNRQIEYKGCIWRLLNYYRSSVEQVSYVVLSFENGICITTNNIEAIQNDAWKQSWFVRCFQDQNAVHLDYYSAKTKIYDGLEPSMRNILCESFAIHDKNGKFIGAVNIGMYIQALEQSISNILNNNGAYIYILDDDGKIIYSPIVGSIPNEASLKNVCIEEVYNNTNKWRIIGVVPMTDYLLDIKRTVKMTLLVILIAMILMSLSAKHVFRTITEPIQKLQHLMAQAENGDLTVRFQEDSLEEIKCLGESFNVMIKKLEQNIHQVYIEQRAKRKAEVAAFQANIKPHFLYNTLDTIHWMAKEYQANDIVETVDALATLFRIALSKGNDVISIEQEIKHVTSYLQIQKTRYEDMINYEIFVAANCKKLKVLKLILQPLVENAIYHGIKNSGRVGMIRIYVWREKNDVMLVVEDDGIGMSARRLEEVKNALRSFNPETKIAYGVINVHNRLFLEYGAPYGLYLESEEGVGTTAFICHPIIDSE
ncbi:sensor histidine kinase [Lachnospiraceae bacterium OF09-6]|nr:sensor histidine kinase [Lachnospiraceae bacterium OF09-6]